MVDESVQVSHRTTWERISDESVQVGDHAFHNGKYINSTQLKCTWWNITILLGKAS